MARPKQQKKPFSKLSITELKKIKANEKRKATIAKKKIDSAETKTEQRKVFNEVIQKNKNIEKIELQIEKKKLQNKVKSAQQLIERNKGKDTNKVRKAEFEIEILKEKIVNPEFKEPEIISLPDDDYFTFTSAFYYFNETKNKLLEMLKNKEIKSLNGKKSAKAVAQLVNEIFLQLDSSKAVQIDISMNTDKAFINIITMEEAKEGDELINS